MHKKSKYLLIIFASFCFYILFLFALYPYIGTKTASLAIIPVIFSSWFFGMMPGFLVALLFIPLNILLLALAGEPVNSAASLLLEDPGPYIGLFLSLLTAKAGKIYRVSEEQIAAHKIIENSLQISEESYKALLNVIPDIIVKFDGAGNILTFSAPPDITAFCKQEEITGKNLDRLPEIYEFIPAELVELTLGNIRETLLTSEMQSFEYILPVKQENYFHQYRFLLCGKHEVMMIIQDITIRKRAEEALQESMSKYKNIFENIAEGIVQYLQNGNIITTNQVFVKMLGYDSLTELLKLCTLQDIYHDKQELEEIFEILADNKAVNDFETILRKRDGSLIHVRQNVTAVKDSSGKNLYFEATVADITRQKNLERQVAQSYRLESVATVTGRIAHDFNNLFNAIHLNLFLAKPQLDKNSPLIEIINEIQLIVNQASELSGKILAFSRKLPAEKKEQNLNTIISSFSKTLRRTIEENILIEYDLDPQLPLIICDGTQMEQMLLNLCSNSRDAMPAGGRLTIKTSGENIEPSFSDTSQTMDAKPGKYVCLEVSDTGPGIQAGIREQIFDPFFTTREGTGKGMGLAVVQGIVSGSDGFISLNNEKENSTVFRIFFPAAVSEAGEKPGKPPETTTASGAIRYHAGETILLVEDNRNLRLAISKLLHTHGYMVLLANNGIEALDIFSRNAGNINLVITDLVMPNKSGLELYEDIIGIYPDTRFLFTSGYSDPVNIRFIVKENLPFIRKPYPAENLLAKIRELCDSEIKNFSAR
jgi:two-component system cell cycle sensor histidine kinase/response regulator CckA